MACAPGLAGLSFSARSSFETGCQSSAHAARTKPASTSPINSTATLLEIGLTIILLRGNQSAGCHNKISTAYIYLYMSISQKTFTASINKCRHSRKSPVGVVSRPIGSVPECETTQLVSENLKIPGPG